jgi:MtaA/CmuA family methyltransferase
MNGFQRIRAALNGEWPDTIPVMLHNFMTAAKEAGFTQEAFRNSASNIAESFIRAVETYGYDGVYVDIDTVTLAGAVGVPVDFPKDEPARSHEPLLHELEEITKLKKIDVQSYKYVQVWLEAVQLLVDHFGDEIFIRGNCDAAPFSLASSVRSPQNWMIDLINPEKEELVFQLIRYCEEVVHDFIKLMAETGAHMISNGDSPAGPSMISPAMYEKFAQPSEKTIVELVHSLNLPYCLHICGNIDPILELVPKTGTDAMELDYMTNIKKAHDVFKNRITFFGNIDPSGVLALGSTSLVEEKTEELLAVYSDTPFFVLNAGCAMPKDTPSENIKAMINTARKVRHV